MKTTANTRTHVEVVAGFSEILKLQPEISQSACDTCTSNIHSGTSRYSHI